MDPSSASTMRSPAIHFAHDLRDFSTSPMPRNASTSGISAEAPWRSAGQAARHDQRLQVILFVFRHFQNRVDGFLLSRFDKAAGIDNDGVGLGRIGFSSKPSESSTPSISSASTRFFAQPRETIPILIPTLHYSSSMGGASVSTPAIS